VSDFLVVASFVLRNPAMEQKRSKRAIHPSQLLGLEKSKQLGGNICKSIVRHLVDSFSNIALLTPCRVRRL